MFERGNISEQIRKFDAYPKTLEDFRVKTFSGAAGKHFFKTKSLNRFLHFFI